MMMQYVECKFPNSSKSYCYHWDGAPLAIGDKVDVMTDRGALSVEVVGFRAEKPPFATKPIMGKVVSPAAAPERPNDEVAFRRRIAAMRVAMIGLVDGYCAAFGVDDGGFLAAALATLRERQKLSEEQLAGVLMAMALLSVSHDDAKRLLDEAACAQAERMKLAVAFTRALMGESEH